MPIYSKSQEQYLLDKLNELNPEAAMPADKNNVSFGKPVAVEATKSTDSNTSVLIRAKQRQGYLGSHEVNYRRIDIATYFKNISVRVSLPDISRSRQAVAHLNGMYGLNLKPEDVEDVALYPSKRFVLRITPHSLQYTGNVSVFYKPGSYDINQLLVNKKLDKLTHPVAIDGRKCAKMLSWGIDFTDDRSLLQAMTVGGLAGGVNQQSGRSDELVNIMVAHGFPQWSYQGARWNVVATTALADCNKQYDMVAVISNVDDPVISGDIYLHYNV